MIIVTNAFYRYHAVTLVLTFDLLQGQICWRAGNHNFLYLLVTDQEERKFRYNMHFLVMQNSHKNLVNEAQW